MILLDERGEHPSAELQYEVKNWSDQGLLSRISFNWLDQFSQSSSASLKGEDPKADSGEVKPSFPVSWRKPKKVLQLSP